VVDGGSPCRPISPWLALRCGLHPVRHARHKTPPRVARRTRAHACTYTPPAPPASCITCIRDPRSKYVHGTWWVVVVYTTCGRPGEAGWRWRVGAQGNSRTKQEVASTAGSQPRFYTQKTPLAIQTPPPPPSLSSARASPQIAPAIHQAAQATPHALNTACPDHTSAVLHRHHLLHQ
jgi:hypothetical protein